MIDPMLAIVAVIVGLVLGLFVSSKVTDFILIIFYHHSYLEEKSYLAFYDLMDDEATYKVVQAYTKDLTSYAKYLELHQKAHDKVYVIFRKHYGDALRYVIRFLLVFTIIPTAILWRYWFYYLIAFLAAILISIYQKSAIKNNRSKFYSRLMLSSVLAEYSSTDKK